MSDDINCYLPVTEADEYFRNRLRSSVWLSATFDDKAAALTMATNLIDLLPFNGRSTTSAQPHAWPRVCVRDALQRPVASDVTPQGVLDACCEWALDLLTNDPSKPKAVITHKQVGDLQTDYAPTLPDQLPRLVRTFLEPYLRVSANTAEIVF